MSSTIPQNASKDLESGKNPDGDQTRSASNPEAKEPSFGDSSEPFFSMYSNAAEEEDNKMVKSWQKDADGILIFTGLFSAAVAALLTLTIQDLRPTSQDKSAYYLGNIYDILANPNTTRASPLATPPFSRPRYAIWVNSLWFLSLVMSLSCALLATSLQQWARRYIRLTQPARRSPEKRARMRSFYSNGVDNMHIPWAVEGLPTLLHLSLFLFFFGLAIFLFNVDDEVFTFVVSWIGLFSMVYGLITLLPLIWHDSPYYTPLSKPSWFLYASILYIVFRAIRTFYDIYYRFQRRHFFGSDQITSMWWRYRGWVLNGMEKTAEETAEGQSSKIDIRILDWTVSALGEDDSLEKFFGAIPGLFNSKLVKDLEINISETLLYKFWFELHMFVRRTLSSNSVPELAKSRRVDIYKDIASMIPCPFVALPDDFSHHYDRAPVSIEKLQIMARSWCTHMSVSISSTARIRAARILATMEERDDRWIALAGDISGLSEDDLRRDVTLAGDNMLLATVVDTCRQTFRSDNFGLLEFMKGSTEFDIGHTLPGLQRDFCTLWNELVQAAKQGSRSHHVPVYILREIRLLYISLHQGTDAAPTAFSASTSREDEILNLPLSYPSCEIASHRPDSTAHVSVPNPPSVPPPAQPGRSSDALSGGDTVSRQVKRADITGPSSPSDPTTSSNIGDSSRAAAATERTEPALLTCTSSHPTDTSPSGAVAAAPQDIPLVAMLSHTPEGTGQDLIASGASSTSSPLLPITSSLTDFPIPAFSPPSHVPPSTNTEILALLSSTVPSRPTGDAAFPRLRARGLVNTGGICFVNAVLQLLLHSPPFWDLFRNLGNLKGVKGRGAGGPATVGSATPLTDATVRFFDEFVFKDESPSTQEPPQQAAGGKLREVEGEKKEHDAEGSFEPTYLYDGMREKEKLKNLLDGKSGDAEEFFRLYLDALDEELLTLLDSISGHKPATAAPGVEEREVPQSGQTDMGERGFTAKSVDSPLMRIFGGKFRSTVLTPNQPDTVAIEDWRSIQLDIQHESVHAVEDALARIPHLQPVQLDQSGLGDTNQKVLVEGLPPILVLHLKRFVSADGIVKISKPVQFTPELEIPLEIMAPISGKSAEPVHYRLYGVLYHHGESAGCGHYTVDVLHQNEDSGSGESWLHIDDKAVGAMRPDDVFGGHNNERVDDGCAYMLFYCRAAPTQT